MAAAVVVIGVGNPFRRDDGLGPAVLAELATRDRPGIDLVTCTGETAELMELWTGRELAIVVDAVRTVPACPGRVHRRVAELTGLAGAASSHTLGLGEAVELARVLGRLPDRLVMYGVEVSDVDFGAGLSGPVARAARELAAEIGRTLGHPDAAPAG